MHVRFRVLAVSAVIGAAALGAVPALSTSGSATFSASCGSGMYRNSDGVCVPSPSSGQPSNGNPSLPPDGAPGLVGAGVPSGPPPGATAQCRDGNYSYSTHHTGTCSGQGGVRQWLNN